MHKVAIKLLCILLLIGLSGPRSLAGDVDHRIIEEAARVESLVIEWRRDIHQNPEKANAEFRTAALAAEHLRSIGLDHVITGVAGTGVIGILKGGKPGATVALRADMDAVYGVAEINDLPFKSKIENLAHVCGHDAHVAMLMGTASVLAAIREELHGNVMFIFQPAEEGAPGDGLGPEEWGGAEGARLMLEEGLFTERFLEGQYRPSAVFSIHVDPMAPGTITYFAGTALYSSDWFRVVVTEPLDSFKKYRGRGVGPYAAVASFIQAWSDIPNDPVHQNAPYPTISGFNSVQTLPRGKDASARRRVEIVARLSTASYEAREHGIARVQEIADELEGTTGSELNVTVARFAPPTINDEQLITKLRDSLIGIVGVENILETPSIRPAADDVALFLQDVPGIFMRLGVNAEDVAEEDAATNHSPEFFVNENALVTGVEILSTLSWDFLALSEAPETNP